MTETIANQSCNIYYEKKSTIGRCNFDGCTKKFGLMPFVCRCEKEYCAKHRMPESHQCMYDYKTNGKTELLKHNNQVIHIKIEKI